MAIKPYSLIKLIRRSNVGLRWSPNNGWPIPARDHSSYTVLYISFAGAIDKIVYNQVTNSLGVVPLTEIAASDSRTKVFHLSINKTFEELLNGSVNIDDIILGQEDVEYRDCVISALMYLAYYNIDLDGVDYGVFR